MTADDAANNISIFQQPNGRFNVVGFNGEVFTGPTTNLLIRNLTVNLGAGQDTLGIGKQSVVSLPGLPAQILGTTTVNSGAGGKLVVVLVNGGEAGGYVLPARAINVDTSPTVAADGASNIRDDDVLVGFSSALSISMKTGGGNDVAEIYNTQTLNLNVDTGPAKTAAGIADNDLIEFGDVVALNASLSGGGGNNSVSGTRSLFGNLSATTGAGADNVRINNSVIGTSLLLNTGAGADTVNLHDLQIGLTSDAPAIFAQYGITLPQLPFNLFQLTQYLPSLPGLLTVSTGDGDDVVELADLHSTLSISVSLDGGNDKLYATDIDAFYSLFNGGLGNDGEYSSGIDGLTWSILFESALPPLAPAVLP
ncbi:hypothetical protein [Anatilimnocola floriformis]|uniref:hypothetical protein n=1 Tax=Anatilimnocola floriformis TaxID=2948575 RepID=UPI0020C41DCF|nr:hypothetical protein [Anatilimnocola floriformis]